MFVFISFIHSFDVYTKMNEIMLEKKSSSTLPIVNQKRKKNYPSIIIFHLQRFFFFLVFSFHFIPHTSYNNHQVSNEEKDQNFFF